MREFTLTNLRATLRNVLWLAMVSSIALLSSPALPQNALKAAGELWVNGPVEVNGKAATTGMTVFSGSKIKVGPGGAATVQMGKKTGSIKLLAETEMILNLASGVLGGELPVGRITVATPRNVLVNVSTAAGLVTSREPLESVFTIEANAEKTKICVEQGKASFKMTGPVPPGTASLKAPGTDAPIDEGESLTATITGQLVRHRCARLEKQSDNKGKSKGGGGSGAVIVPVVIAAAAAGAVPAIVAGATPPSSSVTFSPSSGQPVTPVRPTPTAPFCECRFNPATGRVLNPRQLTVVCRRAGNSAPVTQALTCAALQSYFNSDGTPRLGHENDTCGVCSQN